MNPEADAGNGTRSRRVLSECLTEVVHGVGAEWRRYRVLGARRAGLAEAKEKLGKFPERYKVVSPRTIFYNPMRILIGSIAMVDDHDEPGITSPDYVVFRTRPGLLHHRWFYYWLRSPFGDAFIKSLARGAVRERLLFRRLAAAEIDLPSWNQQEKFADAVTKVERARAAADARLEAATALTSLLLRGAFLGITPLSVQPARESTPAGWEWRRLTDVARLESGHTPSRNRPEWWDGNIPWIALPDIRDLDGKTAYNTIERINQDGVANSAARILPAGTVVLSRTASVGFVTIMGRPMTTSQDFVNWVCGPELDSEFLAFVLRASREYVRALGSGAVHKTVYVPTVKRFHVCVPKLTEQRRIVRLLNGKLAAAETARTVAEAEFAAIDSLPASLLRQAFSGKL